MLISEREPRLLAALAITALLVVASGCRGFFVNPTVSSVSVSPATNNLQSGATRQLTAMATNNDGTTSDVTGSAVWDSSDTTQTFVTLSSTGLVKAVQNTTSPVTITATFKSFSGTATVTVGQTITITCSSCSGNSISLATSPSGSSVTLTSSAAASWSSDNSAIISVTGSNTTAPTATVGGSTGTATITATGTAGGTGTLQITVTQ